ncbi:gamma carbonic anhydrase family protein [Oceanibacterium hippocampi]|uniref:2,3,4,5-tetrahydropyridine-2,6-dicarboxylate N-acetyltransferase n=1 Tax=Oceanibacterium hippocampi TaxID=745714 RepID=A0A1Y5TRH1_9PROT|nr:gamma carbonic anhydrase family protein [Oceanibacterium hippocampi]SLN70341.1 2,3,4,5-tetrahydropyridine-2,6-dicarboxylate N-acetyltransferase [Oceanibacterium hippocampi]
MAINGPDVTLDHPAFIHPSAEIFGKVHIGRDASVWLNVVIRAENQSVEIGEGSNVQDFVMIHVGASTGTRIGRHCSIAHHSTVHGCTLGDNCLVGINVTIMDGAVIGKNCVIGGHSLITENTVIPDNSIVMGTPGRVVKTRNSFMQTRMNALAYVRNAKAYAAGRYREWDQPEFVAAMMAARAEFEREMAEAESAMAEQNAT